MMTLWSRVESLVIHPEATGDDRHRRRYLATCILIFLPLGLGLVWADYAAGRMLESVSVFVVLIPLAASLGILRFDKDIRWGYRMVVVAVIGLLTFLLTMGGGGGYAFVWFYFLPPGLYYLFGSREGTAWFLASLLPAGAVLTFGVGFDYPSPFGGRFLLSYAIVGALALGLQRSRDRVLGELREEKAQLEGALAEVRTLSEMLPMCAWCGSVRDDEGYWSRIEQYLGQRTGTQVTHSLCPSCEASSFEEGADAPDAPMVIRPDRQGRSDGR